MRRHSLPMVLALALATSAAVAFVGATGGTSGAGRAPMGRASRPSAAASRQQAPHQAYEVLQDLPYWSAPAAHPVYHRLDLYLPLGRASVPAVVFLHGGGWTSGNKTEGAIYGNVAGALAQRGVAVALANYRLEPGAGSALLHPGQVEDVARAAAYLRAVLNARGVTPARLLVMGHDAGAHLAALLATNGRFLAAHGLAPSDLDGAIGLSGVYRVDPSNTALSDVFGVEPAGRLDASPIDHISSLTPPHLLLVADDDLPGRSEEAATMAAALVAAGVPAVAERVPSRDHRSIVERIGEPGDPVTARVLYFVTGGSLATPTPPPTALPTGTPTATPTATAAPVGPPTQPSTGPGGTTRAHDVAIEGPPRDTYRAWWPSAPDLAAARVVIFVPDAPDGSNLQPSDPYRDWIRHTVRGGAVVVAPAMGARAGLRCVAAAEAVQLALQEIDTSGGPSVSRDRAIYVGDGAGALVAACLAAEWLGAGVPAPAALLVVSPRLDPGATLADLRRLPRDTLTLVVRGDEDGSFDPSLERFLWSGLAEMPGAWRQFLVVRSDRHGLPSLVAGPGWPRAAPEVPADALDWFGTWKWLDALSACAYDRQDCQYALGDTPEQRHMGLWADGTPVVEPTVRTDVPPAISRLARFPFVLR